VGRAVIDYLLDTDIFSLFLRNDVNVVRNVIAHLSRSIAVSIITVQEVCDGWVAAINQAKTPARLAATYARLTDTINELRNWSVVSFSVGAITRYSALKQQKLNAGGNDLRIASIALELGATVVTRNRRDFSRIPGLVIEDWSI
jgi:tRNA(fMet)-specific endonuclease VapC